MHLPFNTFEVIPINLCVPSNIGHYNSFGQQHGPLLLDDHYHLKITFEVR
jgi:hypothetical protein